MELESQRKEFAERGIHLAAVSYDSVEVLKAFSDRAGIGFPLIADPDLKVIRAFDLVNRALPQEDPWFGFAYAGYFRIDHRGIVESRYFNESNNDRVTSAGILVREFHSAADSPQGEAKTPHLTLSWSVSNGTFRPGQRGVLILEVEPEPGMHLYSPEVEGYIPIAWTQAPAEGLETGEAVYPTASRLHLPAIEETVPVYDSPIRILRDIHILGSREFPAVLTGKSRISLEGEFRYQACDADRCYLPTKIPLRWVLGLADHDLVRVPEGLQRGAS